MSGNCNNKCEVIPKYKEIRAEVYTDNIFRKLMGTNTISLQEI
jgi:hypothetical protein